MRESVDAQPVMLADVVAAASAVAATRSRLAKVDALAGLLDVLGPDEIATAVGLLTAAPRQGRLGIGWRTLTQLDGAHSATPRLSIADVSAAFDALASAGGPGAAAVRTAVLGALASAATADEWDFLARVIMGELRTGALEGVLLDAVARASGHEGEAVRRAAMLSGDLGATAAVALTEPAASLHAISLRVGRGVLPMLASTAGSVADALAITGEASVEYKLDGARIQVHRCGDEVRVLTRSLADVTHRVPELVDVVRSLPAHDLILDGETLALGDDGAPRPFQETMARFGSTRARELALLPWFFDVLHVDGRDLLDEPLRVRREELARVVPHHRIPSLVTSDASAAQAFADRALAEGQEGVLVKALEAPYSAGRRGKTWIKVKPVHTLDLVVLAVEEGSGRRAGWLSNLHLGAWDPEGEFGEAGAFVMVGKTFKGLTDALLRWQSAHFPTIETSRSRGTVFVAPTTVVEIAIDGVQRSPRYPGGVALRFARVKAYRPDKAPADADTIQTVRAYLRE